MRHTLSYVRNTIARFWRPRVEIDFLELSYALMDEANRINERELEALLTKRAELKRKKKKHAHLDREIQQLKAKSILNHMRAK